MRAQYRHGDCLLVECKMPEDKDTAIRILRLILHHLHHYDIPSEQWEELLDSVLMDETNKMQ